MPWLGYVCRERCCRIHVWKMAGREVCARPGSCHSQSSPAAVLAKAQRGHPDWQHKTESHMGALNHAEV